MRVLLVAIALTGAAANNCADYPCKVETYWCEEGGGPPKGEVCPPPTPAPVKAYSYNFETMQPTNSPTPQSES